MTFQQTKNELLSRFYAANTKQAASTATAKKVFDYHKKNFEKFETFEEYVSKMPDAVRKAYDSVPSISAECRKQFQNSKAMQAGIIDECLAAYTIANVLNATSFYDLDESTPQSISHLISLIHGKPVRYIYVNAADNIAVMQSGAPQEKDVYVFFKNHEFSIEVKQNTAKAGEYDFRYDEDGGIVCPRGLDETSITMLESFISAGEDLFDYIGTNYKFSHETGMEAVKKYFGTADFYAVADDKSNLVLMNADDLELEDSEGHHIITSAGSEIRMAGRNHGKVFTPELMKKAVEQARGIVKTDKIMIPVSSCTDRKARGKRTVSGYKFGTVFYIPAKSATREGDWWSAPLSCVQQLRPTVSPHIVFQSSKANVSKALGFTS